MKKFNQKFVEAYTEDSKQKFHEWKKNVFEELKLALHGKTQKEREEGFSALMEKKLAKRTPNPPRPKKEEVYSPEELEKRRRLYREKRRKEIKEANRKSYLYRLSQGEAVALGDHGIDKKYSPSKSKWAKK